MAGWLVALFASAFLFLAGFALYRSERRAWRMVAWAGELLEEPSVPLPGRPVTADEGEMRQVTALELMDPECLGFVCFQLRESEETGSRVQMSMALPDESTDVVREAVLELAEGIA